MSLIVQKYGGTSVGDVERIKRVARRVVQAKAEGHDLVVVVSAMAGETDRLLGLAAQVSDAPDERELDVIVATGEQISIGLLSLAIQQQGCKARSFTGSQVRIQTDAAHTKAKIVSVEADRGLALSERDHVAVLGASTDFEAHLAIGVLACRLRPMLRTAYLSRGAHQADEGIDYRRCWPDVGGENECSREHHHDR